MKYKFLLAITVVLLMTTCGKDPDDPIIITDPGFVLPTIIPTGNEQYLNFNSDYIFDQDKLATFDLQLSPQALSTLDSDPAAEQYVEGMLIFEGDTISPVGIRYKGSVGGFVNCVSGSDWFNPSGHKICTKLSLKVKINWDGREDKFYGLKKLQFHSQNLDDSQLHERLAYWLFQAAGVPSPRSVHARVMVNGKYAGLYALTEQIDGRFVKQNFDDDDGNLYKEVWPLKSGNIPHAESVYLGALKTNEDENPSVDIIRNFAQELADSDPSTIQDIITESMDINETLPYAVVDRLIRHDDGPFHWYCGGGQCSSHNFYWYEEPNNKQLHLIPWDMDNTFENIIFNSNPVTPIADGWGETSNNCQPFSSGLFSLQQLSASCDKLTAGWASFTGEYETIRNEFINGPFAESQVNSLIDTWALQIRDATIEAQDAHEDAVTLESWEQEIEKLKQQLEFAREH